jgi:hypothetical protein
MLLCMPKPCAWFWNLPASGAQSVRGDALVIARPTFAPLMFTIRGLQLRTIQLGHTTHLVVGHITCHFVLLPAYASPDL